MQQAATASRLEPALAGAKDIGACAQVYETPLSSFATDAVPGRVFTVPVVEGGRPALETINAVCLRAPPCLQTCSLACGTALPPR